MVKEYAKTITITMFDTQLSLLSSVELEKSFITWRLDLAFFSFMDLLNRKSCSEVFFNSEMSCDM